MVMLKPLLLTKQPVAVKPKPLPYPARLRERKPRRMTLANAFRCRNGGILLCADREENDGYNKREVDKIYRIRELHAFEVFVSGSGPSGVITRTCAEIHELLLREEYAGSDLWNEHKQIIETKLKTLHRDYSANLKQFPMNLLMVIAERSQFSPLLYRTDLAMLIPEQQYAACGTGKPISDYLTDRLYQQPLDKRAAVVLAAFIGREAEASASGVGFGMDMVVIHENNRSLHFIPPNKVKELASSIPDLLGCITPCWEKSVEVPDWLD
jgi:20S proteasome alpha/beta subunit